MLIAERRRELGITQKQLADEIGTYQSHVSRWERGETLPSAGMVDRLAHALGVSPEWLESARKSAIMLRKIKSKRG